MTDTAPVSHAAFSASWVEAWGRELNTNPTYQEVAAAWEGDIVLEMAEVEGTQGPAVYLDLWRGACRAARMASPDDHAGARYLFRASRRVWQQVLAGKLAPAMAILTGKLRLARGSLMDFLPYASVAEQLLLAGGSVETHFPDD